MEVAAERPKMSSSPSPRYPFAHQHSRCIRYDRMPKRGTPDASRDLPKWIMHPIPDVRFGGIVLASRFLQVAPYVKVPWKRQPASARTQ